MNNQLENNSEIEACESCGLKLLHKDITDYYDACGDDIRLCKPCQKIFNYLKKD